MANFILFSRAKLTYVIRILTV